MATLPLVTNGATAKLGAAFTPYQIEYERIVPGPTAALDGPALQIKCIYRDYEASANHELLEYSSGDWQGSIYVGDNSARIHAIYMPIPAAPFQMKMRLMALFQRARGCSERKSCQLNYRLVEDTLNLDTFAYPGHWLLEVMFPTS